MLQRWPLPFLSSASRMKRDVTPWATPVSTTFPGWRWRVKHQIDRTSAASPSFQPLKLRGPARTPFRSSPSITSGHKAQNSELTLHGYGQPSRRCRRCSQSASALYRSGGVGPLAMLSVAVLECRPSFKRIGCCRRQRQDGSSQNALYGLTEHKQAFRSEVLRLCLFLL